MTIRRVLQDNGLVEGPADVGVELDVDGAHGLDPDGVPDGAGEDEAAAGDGDNEVGDPAGGDDLGGQLALGGAEEVPGEVLPVRVGGPGCAVVENGASGGAGGAVRVIHQPIVVGLVAGYGTRGFIEIGC